MKKSIVKFALIQLLTFLFVTTAFAEVTRQPYLQKLTSNSVLIRWQTDRFVKTVVYYGTSIDSLVFSKSNSDEKTINHSINITNLSPDTKYYYSVEGSEKGNLTNILSQHLISDQMIQQEFGLFPTSDKQVRKIIREEKKLLRFGKALITIIHMPILFFHLVIRPRMIHVIRFSIIILISWKMF